MLEVDRRVGLLVPPENPTVEPELAALIQTRAALHVARLPITPGADLRGRLDGYRAGLAATLDQFGELPLSAVLIACTGAFYAIGPDRDAELCDELSERYATPVRSATQTILDELRRLERTRVVIVSPYPSWLTEAACEYWTAAGLTVTRTVEFADGRSIYEIGADDVRGELEAIARVADAGDALLVSGTGVPTIAAIDEIQPRVAPMLLSSNLCGSRWLRDPDRAASLR